MLTEIHKTRHTQPGIHGDSLIPPGTKDRQPCVSPMIYHFYPGRVEEFEMVGITDLLNLLAKGSECPPHLKIVRSGESKSEGVSNA